MMLTEALGTEHHFSVEHTTWNNGKMERFNAKVVKTAKAILSEIGGQVSQ